MFEHSPAKGHANTRCLMSKALCVDTVNALREQLQYLNDEERN